MLTLLGGDDLDYMSNNWHVIRKKVHKPNVTPTTTPGVGYGGFGWILTIVDRYRDGDLIVNVHKCGDIIKTLRIINDSNVLILPDGGVIDDYQISIKRFEEHYEHLEQ